MLRTLVCAFCLALLFSPLASAQIKLERKLVDGSTYTTDAVQRFEQKLTIAGMETETSSESKSTVKSTVGQRDGLGTIREESKPLSLQVNMTVMGANYFFDSANPDNAGTSALEILRDVHKALTRRTTTIVYDKDNHVQSIESDVDVLSNANETVRALAKSQLDPENLKKIANQELAKLPSDPVNKGDSWQRTESVNFGSGQVMTFETRYTYEGTVQKDGRPLEKITAKVEKVDFALQDSPLPLTVKAAQLKPAESETTILFDTARGQAVESTSNLHITGELTFVAANQELPAKLDLKIESSSVMKP